MVIYFALYCWVPECNHFTFWVNFTPSGDHYNCCLNGCKEYLIVWESWWYWVSVWDWGSLLFAFFIVCTTFNAPYCSYSNKARSHLSGHHCAFCCIHILKRPVGGAPVAHLVDQVSRLSPYCTGPVLFKPGPFAACHESPYLIENHKDNISNVKTLSTKLHPHSRKVETRVCRSVASPLITAVHW